MNTQEHISMLHSSVQPMAIAFLNACNATGFPNIIITQSYRSITEQNALWNQGRVAPGKIVTNAKGGQSWHNYGLAFDIADSKDGYNLNWDKLGRIGESVGLEWGGRWTSFVDRPHFQYIGGLSLSQAAQGKRPQLLAKYSNQSNNESMTTQEQEEFNKVKKYVFEYHEKNLSFLNELTGDMSKSLKEIESTINDLATKERVKKLRERIEIKIGELPKLAQ